MSRAGALLLCLAASAGCGSGGAGYPVTLEVQDGWIREPGAACAGSRPFLYVHRDAVYRVLDADGEAVATGGLPDGRAVEAYNEDLGVPKVPTFCRFRFSVTVPEPGDYRLALEQGDPLAFSAGSEDPIFLVIA